MAGPGPVFKHEVRGGYFNKVHYSNGHKTLCGRSTNGANWEKLPDGTIIDCARCVCSIHLGHLTRAKEG